MLEEESLNEGSLYQAIITTYNKRQEYAANMEQSTLNDAVGTIINLIESYVTED